MRGGVFAGADRVRRGPLRGDEVALATDKLLTIPIERLAEPGLTRLQGGDAGVGGDRRADLGLDGCAARGGLRT